MPPAPHAQRDLPDPFAIPSGLPTHLRERGAQNGQLTRCGLFACGAPDRVSDQIDRVDCYDCKAEGPAAAYVVLPDGTTVDRRSNALHDFPYAVASARDTPAGPVWLLEYWADGIGDAEFLRDHCLPGRTGQILPVQHSGCGK
jgi:hypothetical protein